MIIDTQCTNPDCQEKQTDVILPKWNSPLPDCPVCGTPTQRLWTLDRLPGAGTVNECSLRVHFNYMED